MCFSCMLEYNIPISDVFSAGWPVHVYLEDNVEFPCKKMHRFKLDFKSFRSLGHSMQPIQGYICINKMKIKGGGWQKKQL